MCTVYLLSSLTNYHSPSNVIKKNINTQTCFRQSIYTKADVKWKVKMKLDYSIFQRKKYQRVTFSCTMNFLLSEENDNSKRIGKIICLKLGLLFRKLQNFQNLKKSALILGNNILTKFIYGFNFSFKMLF